MSRSSQPGKNVIGEPHISRIRFQVIDEDAGVQKDPAMLLEEGLETSQSQLLRSLSR